MLIELATGQFPYPRPETYIEMNDFIMTLPEPALSGDFSPEFQDFISQCVKKDPKARASAIALAAHPWVLKFSARTANLANWLSSL